MNNFCRNVARVLPNPNQSVMVQLTSCTAENYLELLTETKGLAETAGDVISQGRM